MTQSSPAFCPPCLFFSLALRPPTHKEHWEMVPLLVNEKKNTLTASHRITCKMYAGGWCGKRKRTKKKTCKSVSKSLTAVSLGGCVCGLILNFSVAWHPELYTVFKRWRNFPVAFKLWIPNPLNFGDFLDRYVSDAQECVPDRNLWALFLYAGDGN